MHSDWPPRFRSRCVAREIGVSIAILLLELALAVGNFTGGRQETKFKFHTQFGCRYKIYMHAYEQSAKSFALSAGSNKKDVRILPAFSTESGNHTACISRQGRLFTKNLGKLRLCTKYRSDKAFPRMNKDRDVCDCSYMIVEGNERAVVAVLGLLSLLCIMTTVAGTVLLLYPSLLHSGLQRLFNHGISLEY
ncbi:uncharacterized protein [Narcine bancroftii]|uniref:uncharacterized protein isoform X8 n=1 Tax=Narcine bancroftii TaxID=1343680 RepID=UPI0038315B3C